MNLQDFPHGITGRLFFGSRVFKEDLRNYVQKCQKQIVDMDSLGKYTQIQKTIGRIGVHIREISLI